MISRLQSAAPTGSLTSTLILTGSLSMPTVCADYAGVYDVRPETYPQTLYTAGKVMREDVTVRAIPYYEVDNAAGGNTIIIGGET